MPKSVSFAPDVSFKHMSREERWEAELEQFNKSRKLSSKEKSIRHDNMVDDRTSKSYRGDNMVIPATQPYRARGDNMVDHSEANSSACLRSPLDSQPFRAQ